MRRARADRCRERSSQRRADRDARPRRPHGRARPCADREGLRPSARRLARGRRALQRERPDDAVIVFTKIGDVPARVRALEVGADDAFDASFPHVADRRARRRRRAARGDDADGRPSSSRSMAARSIWPPRPASRDGVAFALTQREVEIVRWLARHAGRVVARDELLAARVARVAGQRDPRGRRRDRRAARQARARSAPRPRSSCRSAAPAIAGARTIAYIRANTPVATLLGHARTIARSARLDSPPSSATTAPAASPELDRVCAQKDAHTSLLYWFTDLAAAIAEATRDAAADPVAALARPARRGAVVREQPVLSQAALPGRRRSTSCCASGSCCTGSRCGRCRS